MTRWILFFRLLAAMILVAEIRGAEGDGIRVVGVQQPAKISRDGGKSWDLAAVTSESVSPLRPGHRLQTGPKGWVDLVMENGTKERIGELSTVIVPEEARTPHLRFFKGIGYFFNRDKPGATEVEGRMVGAVIKGTEFIIEVDENGETKITVLEGEVEMTNAFGAVRLGNGQVGVASETAAPARLPVLISDMPGAIQWVLYYPGVLNLSELHWTAEEEQTLKEVFKAYRGGDLRAALLGYSDVPGLSSPSTHLLGAQLDLAGGRAAQVRETLKELLAIPEIKPQARALQWLIDAVQFKIRESELPPPTEENLSSAELVALSYAYQSVKNLPAALQAAVLAAKRDGTFGFAQARVAELEFSFGRAAESKAALEKALSLSPRLASAWALQGFVLAARNDLKAARESFERAIELDGALANGWLGRGLLKIRAGDDVGGRFDLQMAAALEPQRSFLRSYLGKALDLVGNHPKARHELELAKQADPSDPTPWLYAALLDQNDNRINEAVRELQDSQDRNENRAVYRSSQLLDQDRAVRGARLAGIYADAGMEEEARRTAANSLASDYGNASSHLFLAESYLSLDRVNLRYESARVSEYLIANLLSPAGAGAWSPTLSQQEYSSLFEQDGGGVFSQTEYRSNGRWSESAAGYGHWGGSSVTLDGLYLSDPGYRPNNDQDITSLSFQLKQQITPDDMIYLQPLWSKAHSGDLVEHYDPASVDKSLDIHESQEPILLAGWRHDWAPGHKTLFLFSRLDDTLDISDSPTLLPRFGTSFGGAPVGTLVRYEDNYHSSFEAYAAEAQQIFQFGFGETILGVRALKGSIDANVTLKQLDPNFPSLGTRTFVSDEDSDRVSAYVYQTWKPIEQVQFEAGLTYDRMYFPANFRYAPLVSGSETEDQLSPKVGVSAQPWHGATFRAAYSKSLGGVGFDQSFRLQPTEVAGINQTLRSAIPESVAGSSAAERFEIAGAEFSQEFGRNTWLNFSANWISSKADREVGAIRSAGGILTAITVPTELNYRERTAQIALNRLIGRDFAVGASYRISEAQLESAAPSLAPGIASSVALASSQQSVLQQIGLFGVFNHPSGFFAKAETIWMHQDNTRDVSALAGDDFWQGNLYAGYRFARRRAEVSIGLLNVSDNDYRLYPLSLYAPLPRERTFFVSFKWQL